MAKKPSTRRTISDPGAGTAARESLQVQTPIALRALLGQERAVATLNASLTSGRIHHAWIFHGPPGVGKFTGALAFAAVLLDPTAKAGKDGVFGVQQGSEVQQLLASGTHPDLHVITKELARFSSDPSVREGKQITIAKKVIDENLLEPAALAPAVANHGLASKVFIVDEAELLDRSPTNAPTQNAILKTLEEPPAGTVIILVTSSEDRLLPTIRSRSQRVPFGPLDDAAMKEWIASRPGLFPDDVSASQRAWLTAFAVGSPGRLVEAIRSRLDRWHEALIPMLSDAAQGKFRVELGGTMAEFADGWAKAWVDANPYASKDAANKEGADRVLAMVAEHFRGVLRSRPAGALASPRDNALRSIDLVTGAARELDSNVNLQLVMGNLAAQLAEPCAGA